MGLNTTILAHTPVRARQVRLVVTKCSDLPAIEEFRVLPPANP